MLSPVIEGTGFQVVGTATDTAAALEVCRRERPHIVILDLVLMQSSGLSVISKLRQHCPSVRIIVFSGNIWATALRGALAAGVDGIVEKMSPLSELRNALLAVRDGRVYFSSAVSNQIKTLVCRRKSPQPAVALSEREKDILRYLAEGYTPKEIAATLGLSPYTILNHRSNLLQKIGLRGTAQLSLYAAQIGVTGDTTQPPLATT
jgi:DNA-binding NarL/FixJ family response regulator